MVNYQYYVTVRLVKSQVNKILKIRYLNDDVENSRSYEKFKISTAGS